MKRFHVHLHVDDLARSVAFYSRLFGTAPPVSLQARVDGLARSPLSRWLMPALLGVALSLLSGGALPMTVAMLVFFHRLRVCDSKGGTVRRSACGTIR